MAQITVLEDQRGEPEQGLFNPRNLAHILRRRAWAVLFTVAAVMLLAGVAYALATREYLATGSVALDRRTDQLVDAKSDPKPLTTDSSSVETEVQVIKSPSVAAAVTDGLGLDRMVGFGLVENGDPAVPPSRDRAIRIIQGGLDATRAGMSYAIYVKYSAPDPVLAARIVNAAMNAYTGGQKSSEARQLGQEIAMLRDRIDLVRADVMRYEGSVAQYRAKTGLIDLAANSDAANQSMQQLNTQLAQARADEAAAQAKATGGGSLVTIASSPAISSLRSEQARLQAQQAQLTERYSPGYPALVSINEQLGAVNSAIAAEQSRVRQSVSAEAQIARNRAASLGSSVNHQQSALMQANLASVRLGELERNADAAKSLYSSLLDQYKQKLAAQGTERSKSYVVAYAAPPTSPASPNLLAYLIGGLLAALLGGALVATTLENMEGGVLNQTAAERELGLPVLAAIPDIATVKDAPLRKPTPGTIGDHLLTHPSGVFAESLRSIRTGLNIGQDGQAGKCYAITSSVKNEGKTAMAICLARSTALAGSRVLLIDCDLRHHSCSDFFAPGARSGLFEVLGGHARLEDAVVKDMSTGLDVLPASGSAHPSIDVITSRAMRSLLRGVVHNYDLILLETPPVLPVAESRALAAMADGTILLVRWRTTPVEVVKKAINLLNRAKANIVGTVLSRVSLSWTAVGSLGDDVYYYQSYSAKAA